MTQDRLAGFVSATLNSLTLNPKPSSKLQKVGTWFEDE